MSLVMMVAALLALREAAGVETDSTRIASVAPVTTEAQILPPTTVPPPSTTAPAVSTADVPPGPISLEALAAQTPPETAAPPTTARPKPTVQVTTTTTTVKRRTTTTQAPATTTTTVKKSTTTVAPVARAGTPGARNQTGAASWFSAPDGTCAHNAIPTGTRVTVTRLSTGAITTCVIDQGGPSDPSRIIDLSKDTFEKLAPVGVGLIEVRIEW